MGTCTSVGRRRQAAGRGRGAPAACRRPSFLRRSSPATGSPPPTTSSGPAPPVARHRRLGSAPFLVTEYVSVRLDRRRRQRPARRRRPGGAGGGIAASPPSTRPGWSTATSSRATCAFLLRPKVINFRIARALDATRHHRHRPLIGSPGSMAEQLEQRPVTAAVDIFVSPGRWSPTPAPGGRPFGRARSWIVYRSGAEPPDLDGLDRTSRLRPARSSCMVERAEQRPRPRPAAGAARRPRDRTAAGRAQLLQTARRRPASRRRPRPRPPAAQSRPAAAGTRRVTAGLVALVAVPGRPWPAGPTSSDTAPAGPGGPVATTGGPRPAPPAPPGRHRCASSSATWGWAARWEWHRPTTPPPPPTPPATGSRAGGPAPRPRRPPVPAAAPRTSAAAGPGDGGPLPVPPAISRRTAMRRPTPEQPRRARGPARPGAGGHGGELYQLAAGSRRPLVIVRLPTTGPAAPRPPGRTPTRCWVRLGPGPATTGSPNAAGSPLLTHLPDRCPPT